MGNFQKVKIRDIAKINSDSIGRNFKYETVEYVDISSVGVGNLIGVQEMNIKNAPSRAKRLVKSGDTIISTVRPNRRSFFYFNKPKENTVVSTGFAVIRATEKNDPRYLYYSVTDKSFTSYLTKNAKGTSYPAVDADIIYEGEVFVPKKTEDQVRVGSVLSTYDDLIENNEKRIKALEEMAQLLYTEWFVKFKFPGYEKVKMVESGTEFGRIPAGWEVKNFYEVVKNLDSKRKPISSMKRQEMQGEYPYYGAAKVIDYINDYIFDGRYLLIAEDGSVITPEGKPMLQFVDEKFWVSNHAHVIQGKLLSTEMIFLRLRIFNIKPLITGSAQPKVTKDNLSRISFIIPNKNTNKMFTEIVGHYFDEIVSLKRQINNIIKSRNLLIPQLVTGKRELK